MNIILNQKWNFIKIITQSSHIIDFKITQNWNCFHKLTIKAHRKEMWNQNHTHAHAIPSHELQSQYLSTIPFIFKILPHPNNTSHLHLDKLASLHTEKSYLKLEVWVWGYFRWCTFVAICSDGRYGLLSHTVNVCSDFIFFSHQKRERINEIAFHFHGTMNLQLHPQIWKGALWSFPILWEKWSITTSWKPSTVTFLPSILSSASAVPKKNRT